MVISVYNLVPNGFQQISPAPVPMSTTYNAIASIDGDTSIFSIEPDGYIYLRIGDMFKQYTGEIVYFTN